VVKCLNCFAVGVIIPVPKDKSGDLTDSKNYRGITLSPVISKVFELCLMDLYGEFSYSSDVQFGFKKQLSCSHSIYIMRKVVDYFVSNGSIVNLCSLDISKAFDKVNHFTLYLKLMKRRITPVCLCVLLKYVVCAQGVFYHLFCFLYTLMILFVDLSRLTWGATLVI